MIGRSPLLCWLFVILGSIAVAGVLLLLLGWPLFCPLVASRISTSLGRHTTVGSLHRQGGSLLRPVLELSDVRVEQPSWAGRGYVVVVRKITFQVPLLPLITGDVRPGSIAVVGLHLRLTRGTDGRLNWTDHDHPSAPTLLGGIRITNGLVELTDAKSDRSLKARFEFDGAGFRLSGQGRVGQASMALLVRGAAIDAEHPAAPWPFTVALSSHSVTISLNGVADHPLDFAHLGARLASRGRNLHDLGNVIGIGAPGTQRYLLRGRLRYDASNWSLNSISGTLGRSDFDGRIAVRDDAGRPFVGGTLSFQQLDPGDLASDAGQAVAAAHLQRFGPRLLPETPIHLEHLRKFDGTVHVVVHRLLFAKPSPFTSVSGTANLDHGILTIQPLKVGLVRGLITGVARIDHRAQQPRLSLSLVISDSRLEQFLSRRSGAQGPLRGRIRLFGLGRTVRSAVGHANGTVAFVVARGTLPNSAAELLGQDAGGLLAGSQPTQMRCVIAHFTVRDGLARPSPLLIDTAVSRSDGMGSIDLSSERVAFSVVGRRKGGSVVRLAGPLQVSGILSNPVVGVSARAKAPKGIFKAIFRALTGTGRDPPAEDADCSGLAKRALR